MCLKESMLEWYLVLSIRRAKVLQLCLVSGWDRKLTRFSERHRHKLTMHGVPLLRQYAQVVVRSPFGLSHRPRRLLHAAQATLRLGLPSKFFKLSYVSFLKLSSDLSAMRKGGG